MPKSSAGLLPYRLREGRVEVLLVHPGGPFWARKDAGAWSIAKGEYEPPEAALEAAIREFAEETGFVPNGPYEALTPLKQRSGKIVSAWITAADWDLAGFVSNKFTMEWPKGSGRTQEFPEVDRVEWLEIGVATGKILPGQSGFLDELNRKLTGRP